LNGFMRGNTESVGKYQRIETIFMDAL